MEPVARRYLRRLRRHLLRVTIQSPPQDRTPPEYRIQFLRANSQRAPRNLNNHPAAAALQPRDERYSHKSVRARQPHFHNFSVPQDREDRRQPSRQEIPVLNSFSRCIQNCVQRQRYRFQFAFYNLYFFRWKSQEQFIAMNLTEDQNRSLRRTVRFSFATWPFTKTSSLRG